MRNVTSRGDRTPAADGVVFAAERQARIAELVAAAGRARVGELAARFGVSTVTIRKDLVALEAHGRLVRAHGGAITPGAAGRPEPAFAVRERLQGAQKLAIGTAALERVRDGDTIALDASTSALALARLLRQRPWSALTVVTNGIRAALELADTPGVTVLMPGGRIRAGALSVVGAHGDGVLRRVNVGTAFLGAMGLTVADGLTDGTEEEAALKRTIVAAAREVHALVDHTKWGRVATARFCRLDRVSRIFTDRDAPAALVAALRDQGITVTIVEEDHA